MRWLLLFLSQGHEEGLYGTNPDEGTKSSNRKIVAELYKKVTNLFREEGKSISMEQLCELSGDEGENVKKVIDKS